MLRFSQKNANNFKLKSIKNKKNMNNKLIIFIFIVLLVSCNSKKEQKAEEPDMEMTRAEINKNYVDTMVLGRSIFNKQIICNGKLRAIAKSKLTMPGSGILKAIKVHNGSLVKKGELMAEVDKSVALIDLKQAKRQMEKAKIDLIDKLIGQGFDEDTTNIPPEIIQRAKITSGYVSAEEQLERARHNFNKCSLYAPFSGRVANMDCKLYERADKFCTLIDDSYFDVEFNILEAEMGIGVVGQKVIVSPFVNEQKKYIGKVTEVNPIVDDKGQIKIRAKIKNQSGELIEGMNVRIILESYFKNMFVVPKDAVVLRDGYYVIFKYVNGEALWTYVDVLFSNLDSYAITGNKKKKTKIKENDVIITSGNLNLADGTKVIPNKKTKN